jgi:hypothetical protein
MRADRRSAGLTLILSAPSPFTDRLFRSAAALAADGMKLPPQSPDDRLKALRLAAARR